MLVYQRVTTLLMTLFMTLYKHLAIPWGLSHFWQVGILNMSANPDHPFHVAVGNNKAGKSDLDLGSVDGEWNSELHIRRWCEKTGVLFL